MPRNRQRLTDFGFITGCHTLLLALLLACTAAAADAADADVQFNRDIRPILSNHCFQCHGPDEAQRQADLRLDVEHVAKEYAIVAGKPDESEVIARITSTDDDLRMPPAAAGKPLSPHQVELLRRWIASGAKWQEHWSLSPPQPQTPPAIDGPQVANDIDRFLLHRLRQQQLEFSPRADARTLIRRLYQDVLGLPPSPEEVDAFVRDDSQQAYEQLVDRVLESPRYGERMAIYWLDLVRYADTNGIHGDNHREHWLYRDYVIQAFNDNMPFDQFTREQLAGDLMENPTRSQLIASGYNRLNMTTREGGAQPKEYRAKYAADRVRNASTVWMGATLGCAECHNHKFDPYTAKDFYQFAAFFADLQETAVGAQRPTPLPTAEQKAKLAQLDQQLAELQTQLDQPDAEMQKQLEASLRAWERERGTAEDWQIQTLTAAAENGSEFELASDQQIARVTKPQDKDTYRLTFSGKREQVTGLRIETLPDDKLPAKGPGLAGNGNFVINEVELQVDGKPVALGQATADHSQNGFAAAAATDGKEKTGWAVLPEIGKRHELVIPLKQPASGSEWTVAIQCHHGSKHLPGKLRLGVTQQPAPAAGKKSVPDNIAKLLAIQPDQRDEAQRNELMKWFRGIAPELEPVRQQIAEAKKERDATMAAAPKLLIAVSAKPRMTRVLPRGDWLDDSGEEVLPQTPGFLPQPETDESAQQERLTRMDLANWMVDPNNPFVARVLVNRLWKLAFGHGIVRTLDDFGAQGRWPSHPALLDYLAVDFREHGWDIKRTLRMILLSNAYQQSSAVSPELRELDPFNDLYARQSRFRLDAELVRDNALAVSGLLVNKLGGPSAKPYQPAGYWSHLNFPRRTYQHDKGEDQYRRGVYTYWCRTFLHPSLRAFDATTREECTVERPRSNTPLAALALLNDPTYVEAARALAERAVQHDPAPGKRLQFIFRQTLSRNPTSAEAETLLKIAEGHRQQYADDEQAAQELVSVGLKPIAEGTELADLAAWTSVARAVLNLHETITRN